MKIDIWIFLYYFMIVFLNSFLKSKQLEVTFVKESVSLQTEKFVRVKYS